MSDIHITHPIRGATFLGCVLAGVLGVTAVAQEEGQREPRRQQQERQQPRVQQGETKSVEALIDQLGDSRYRARQSAEEELRRRGDEVLDDLRRAAKDHDDAEVRWRAGRLVRQLEGGQNGLRVRDPEQQNRGWQAERQPPGVGQPWNAPQRQQLDQMFEQMFEQMERQFGIDIPRHSFFADSFFQDLQNQLQQRGMGNLKDFEGQGRAMSMRIDNDGVKVTIQEKDENGKLQTREYEAPDLKSFLDQYPEVAKRLNMTQQSPMPGLRQFWTVPPMPPAIESLPRAGGQRQLDRQDQRGLRPRDFGQRGRLPRDQADADVPAGERLGVMVRADIGPDARSILGLPESGGLLVEEVLHGTLAQELGLQPRDVILEIDGKSIETVEDVQRALRDVAEGQDVAVLVNRRGDEKTLRAKKSSAASEEHEAEAPRERQRAPQGKEARQPEKQPQQGKDPGKDQGQQGSRSSGR